MTPNQQKIAIVAVFHGFKWWWCNGAVTTISLAFNGAAYGKVYTGPERWLAAPGVKCAFAHEDATEDMRLADGWNEGVPDYFNDLNAIHAVEAKFNDEQALEYYDRLLAVTNGFKTTFELYQHLDGSANEWHGYSRVRATAAQRVDAILLTLGTKLSPHE